MFYFLREKPQPQGFLKPVNWSGLRKPCSTALFTNKFFTYSSLLSKKDLTDLIRHPKISGWSSTLPASFGGSYRPCLASRLILTACLFKQAVRMRLYFSSNKRFTNLPADLERTLASLTTRIRPGRPPYSENRKTDCGFQKKAIP